MPLVRISLIEGRAAQYKRAVADAVHQALVRALGIAPDDRFQVITEHSRDELIFDANYLGVQRSDAFVIVQITLRSGRSSELKKALYQSIVDNLADQPGLRREDVMIVLIENELADWSFGKGVASYIS
jgi:phenylpyruvate tautomerase PptA (4-oxalocrotonate tautomerase family)